MRIIQRQITTDLARFFIMVYPALLILLLQHENMIDDDTAAKVI
jgi:hypothetical protein